MNTIFRNAQLILLVMAIRSHVLAEPTTVESEAIPTPSYSFQSLSIESLRRSINCHTRREFGRPGATGECLAYTTGPVFNEEPRSKGVSIDPVLLEVVELETQRAVFSYPDSGLSPSVQRTLSEHLETCKAEDENERKKDSQELEKACLKRAREKILLPALPKQLAIMDQSTGEIESHPVLSVSTSNDPIYVRYNLHIEASKLPQDIDLATLFGIRDSNPVSWTTPAPLTMNFDAWREAGSGGGLGEVMCLRNIPRIPGYAAPEILIFHYPDINQIDLNNKPDSFDNRSSSCPRPVEQDLLVVLISQRTEPRVKLAETSCDPNLGDYWLPTWTALFLVRNNKWHLLYDEIRDFRHSMLTTISFPDLNQDGRRDLILSGNEGQSNKVILTSEGKAFRKWGEGEVSPCGC